eukprot:scaffold60363_cov17-Tisochrysis_lutea.AAC.1
MLPMCRYQMPFDRAGELASRPLCETNYSLCSMCVLMQDLEHLISQAVDPTKANYAVFTGVQIHNWASDLTDSSIPSLEFVASGKSYTVIDGVKKPMDVTVVRASFSAYICLMPARDACCANTKGGPPSRHANLRRVRKELI